MGVFPQRWDGFGRCDLQSRRGFLEGEWFVSGGGASRPRRAGREVGEWGGLGAKRRSAALRPFFQRLEKSSSFFPTIGKMRAGRGDSFGPGPGDLGGARKGRDGHAAATKRGPSLAVTLFRNCSGCGGGGSWGGWIQHKGVERGFRFLGAREGNSSVRFRKTWRTRPSSLSR